MDIVKRERICGMATANKKRKTENGANVRRFFQETWTEKYFFVEFNNKSVCLICMETLAGFKAFSLKRHYNSKHSQQYDTSEGIARKNIVNELKNKFFNQLSQTQSTKESEIALNASYALSEIFAKRLKSFTDDRDFVKECLEVIADIIFPEKKSIISKIHLSPKFTLACRTEDMLKDIEAALIKLAEKFEAFSIAIAECEAEDGKPQLALFIRGVDSSFTVTEEMAVLKAMRNSLTTKDAFETFMKFLDKLKLDIGKLCGIVTNGTPILRENNTDGFFSLVTKEVERRTNQPSKLIIYHFLNHQNVYNEMTKVNCVMTTLVSAISLIQSQIANQPYFQDIFSEIDSEFHDMISHSDRKWLSSDLLKKIYDSKENIQKLMKKMNKTLPEFYDDEWLSDFAFSVDLSMHLNDLNLQMQVNSHLATDLFEIVNGFESKLQLWEAQLKCENALHFPNLNERSKYTTITFATEIGILRDEFKNSFQDLMRQKTFFYIFVSPFTIDIETVPAKYQLELIDLQNNRGLKSKFMHVPIVTFYEQYLPRDEFPQLAGHATAVISLFGSSHIFEQFLSKMKS